MNKKVRNIIIRIGFILFAGMFMMLAISAKMIRDKQVVENVKIYVDHNTGNFFITEEDVIDQLKELLPDSGATIHTKDLNELEQKLQSVPQVKRSNVFVDNNGQLSIDIEQRKPLFRVIKPSSVSYYVDEEGYKFPVSQKYTAKVPVITGNIIDNGKQDGFIEGDKIVEVYDLVQYISKDNYWKSQFGQIYLDGKTEIELIPRVGDHVVQIGDTKNIDEKLTRLRIFYEEGLTKIGINTYKTINVKYKDQVVCKK